MSHKDFNLISVSDIHLGARHTPLDVIINNLGREFITNTKLLKSTDIMVLVGDVFDKELHLSESEKVSDIKIMIARLLKACKKHDVMLRVLDGTKSHDRNQSFLFETINEIAEIGCDVKYITDIHIEHIEKFGVDFLYVPDEIRPTCDLICDGIEEVLLSKGLTQVDYGFTHGMYEFQTPPIEKIDHLKSERVSKYVRYFIFNGHIHQSSHVGKILTNGSFDRIHHGEEDPKGYWTMSTSCKGTEHDFVFVINEKAHCFKTISIRDKSLDEIKELFKFIEDLPLRSNIRVEAYKGDENLQYVKTLQSQYLKINWTFKLVNRADTADGLAVKPVLFKATPINPKTIVKIITRRLNLQGVSPEVTKRAETLMETIAGD